MRMRAEPITVHYEALVCVVIRQHTEGDPWTTQFTEPPPGSGTKTFCPLSRQAEHKCVPDACSTTCVGKQSLVMCPNFATFQEPKDP